MRRNLPQSAVTQQVSESHSERKKKARVKGNTKKGLIGDTEIAQKTIQTLRVM